MRQIGKCRLRREKEKWERGPKRAKEVTIEGVERQLRLPGGCV